MAAKFAEVKKQDPSDAEEVRQSKARRAREIRRLLLGTRLWWEPRSAATGPTLIILDDTLVHSDVQRLARPGSTASPDNCCSGERRLTARQTGS